MSTLEDLKSKSRNLALQIEKSEVTGSNESISLKKEFYNNKLDMLALLDVKSERRSISAYELNKKVLSMKTALRYKTGIVLLDEELSSYSNVQGLEVGSLIVVGGESGAGKSHLLLEILSNVSNEHKVCFFNFEMGDRRLNYRLNNLLKTESQRHNFFINSDSRDLDDLLMNIKILADDGMVFFAIDSKMKISVKGNAQEYQKISEITKRLSEVAIRNDIIIILINQISEEDLKTGRLSFKGSGDQLYDADMALFLVKEADERDDKIINRRLICSKNRQDEKLFSFLLPQPTVYKYEEVEYVEDSNINVSMTII